jgi:hypothetical protein
MKYLFLSLIFLSACGDNVHPTQTVVQTVAATADVSIVNKFTATSSPVVIQNLDLSQVVLNTTQSADLVLSCDGSFGNNVTNNGVTSGNVRTTGTTTQGTIQFGNTKYVGASNPDCNAASKEAYSYNIEGNELTLCLVNPNYPYCTTYRVSN